ILPRASPGRRPACVKVPSFPAHDEPYERTDPHLTQNQLHDLLESESARSLVENAEERGYIELVDFEAFVLEHDLSDDEIEQLTRELETIGLDVGPPVADEGKGKAAK